MQNSYEEKYYRLLNSMKKIYFEATIAETYVSEEDLYFSLNKIVNISNNSIKEAEDFID
ncbi:MAG: hypothetical protein ACOCQR_01405 [bacterium]